MQENKLLKQAERLLMMEKKKRVELGQIKYLRFINTALANIQRIMKEENKYD